jgi:hypothetical protein
MYGDTTPEELADRVPSWSELRLAGGWRATTYDSDLLQRWETACAVAHEYGCPPHWIDLGFVPNIYHSARTWTRESQIVGVDFNVSTLKASFFGEYEAGIDRVYASEFEARLDIWTTIKALEGEFI